MKRTEMRNPNTMNIDKMSSLEIVTVINNEDKLVPLAVEKTLPEIAKTIDMVVDSFNKGGRLLFIGAGTSGRLGVLDASECPPTYGEPPEKVVGIIAGGMGAMFRASENAEDLGPNGIKDVNDNNICDKDTLIGISVAGDAKYVVDALEEAKQYADDQDAALHTVISAEIDADVKVVADALADEKDVNKEGSLAAQIKAEKDRMNAFMTDADVQDKAIDTLKEIQQYINEHGEAAAEMVANIEAAQKAADDEKVRAEAAEAALSERIGEAAAEGKEATGLVKEIADEKARAMKEEADIRDEFAAADQAIVDAQKLVDEVQDNRIKALEDANKDGGAMAEAVKAAQDAADAAQEAADNAQEAADNAQSEVDAVELRVEALEAKHAANGEVDQKIKAVQDAVDVVEGRMDTAESEIDELQAFKDDHSHAQIEADIEALEGNKVDKEEGKSLVLDTEIAKIHEHANKAELDKFEENDKANLDAVVEFMNGHSHETMEQGIEDNAAAIAKEVNDRNAAIEAALEDYSTSDEVKAMLGAVVQSLSMELTDDDKLRLTLGEGVDGITLNEIELDMVTDADIDTIIAGLDTPAAE